MRQKQKIRQKDKDGQKEIEKDIGEKKIKRQTERLKLRERVRKIKIQKGTKGKVVRIKRKIKRKKKYRN